MLNIIHHYIAHILMTFSEPMPHQHRLRSVSTEQIDVPFFHRSMIGGRAFPAAEAKVWNSLHADVTAASSLSVFNNKLKTYSVCCCYDII